MDPKLVIQDKKGIPNGCKITLQHEGPRKRLIGRRRELSQRGQHSGVFYVKFSGLVMCDDPECAYRYTTHVEGNE